MDPNALGAGEQARAGGSQARVAGKTPFPELTAHENNAGEGKGASAGPAAPTWDTSGVRGRAFAERVGPASPEPPTSPPTSPLPAAALPSAAACQAMSPGTEARAADGPSDALLRAADVERRRSLRDGTGSGAAQEERHLRSEIALLNRKVRAVVGVGITVGCQAGDDKGRGMGGRARLARPGRLHGFLSGPSLCRAVPQTLPILQPTKTHRTPAL